MPERREPTADEIDRDAGDDAGDAVDETDAVDEVEDAVPRDDQAHESTSEEIDRASGAHETETDTDEGAAGGDAKATAAKRQLREPKPGSRMTEQEQRWGKWLGLLSAAGFAVGAQPWLGGQHLAQAGLGVAMGMLLWVVARQGFRIRTAIASYMFLFAFGDLFIFGALHIGFAFLLAFRSSREMGQARAAERMRQRKEGPAAQSKPSRGRKSKRTDDGSAGAGSPPPVRVTEPNRRYTPPKPKKKRRR